MNVAIEQLAQRLAAVLGESSVSLDANMRLSHTVDGLAPLLVCLPDTEQQLAAGLRLFAEAGAVVVPYGGGTAISVGNRSRRIDAAFDLTRLNRVAEHDDANHTATVGAGMTLTRLQEVAARQKQFLPIDPPFTDRATIGGIVVTNLNGPRRSCHGSIRDLVIGMKVALASGGANQSRRESRQIRRWDRETT